MGSGGRWIGTWPPFSRFASVAHVWRTVSPSGSRQRSMVTIETRFIAANGIIQHVALAGPARAPAILLVHGLGWDHTLWRNEIDMLAGAGWRAIAPDLRGMGQSDK